MDDSASPTNGGSSDTPSVGQPPLKPLRGRGVLLHEEVVENWLETLTNFLRQGGIGTGERREECACVCVCVKERDCSILERFRKFEIQHVQ